MATDVEPKAESWYESDEGQLFQVVAIDEATGTIEIQYLDGDVDELDPEGLGRSRTRGSPGARELARFHGCKHRGGKVGIPPG